MSQNPIEEIRAIRAAIMREFNNDADKYCDILEEKWKDSGLRFVTPKPKRIKAGPKAAVKETRETKPVKKSKRSA